MSNVKHTQGPWTVDIRDEEFWPFLTQVKTANGQMIAATNYFESKNGEKTGNRIDEANARLIAAAPDMLDALQLLIAAMSTGSHAITVEASMAAIEAIEKATGEGR